MMDPIWFETPTVDTLNAQTRDSLSSHLGIAFTSVDKSSLTAKMGVIPTTMQPVGILHGGATAALAETVGSAAGNYCVNLQESFCVGLELNVNHLRMVQEGLIFATASPFHLGKKTQVWEIKIHDEEGRLVAVSRLTLMVLKRKNPGQERPGVSRNR